MKSWRRTDSIKQVRPAGRDARIWGPSVSRRRELPMLTLVVGYQELNPDVQLRAMRRLDGQPELHGAIVGWRNVSGADGSLANGGVIGESALWCAQFCGAHEHAAVPIDAADRIDIASRKLKGQNVIGRLSGDF
jgi:hypothetical protein